MELRVKYRGEINMSISTGGKLKKKFGPTIQVSRRTLSAIRDRVGVCDDFEIIAYHPGLIPQINKWLKRELGKEIDFKPIEQ